MLNRINYISAYLAIAIRWSSMTASMKKMGNEMNALKAKRFMISKIPQLWTKSTGACKKRQRSGINESSTTSKY